MEDFELTNEKKISQKEWKEFLEFKEEYQENETKRNLLLQKQNDILEGGIRSANLKEYRNTYVINAQDSLDDTYPLYVHFNIIPEMTKIVSIQLSFWFLNFRAYSKGATEKAAVTSGASSAESSASGGGETPTSGASSASSSGGGGVVSSAAGGVVSSASGGGPTSGSGGATTPTSGEDDKGHQHNVVVYDSHDVTYSVHWTAGGLVAATGANRNVVTSGANQAHTHTVSIPNHTHSVPSHTHTGGSHTHTGGTHTHNIEHTHTVTIAAHTHNIPHTHIVPAHTHSLTFGIYEEENSPKIMPYISRDNGLTYGLPLGSYSKDQENLDITRFIDKSGSKMIKFESNARTRISVQVTVKLDIRAR